MNKLLNGFSLIESKWPLVGEMCVMERKKKQIDGHIENVGEKMAQTSTFKLPTTHSEPKFVDYTIF